MLSKSCQAAADAFLMDPVVTVSMMLKAVSDRVLPVMNLSILAFHFLIDVQMAQPQEISRFGHSIGVHPSIPGSLFVDSVFISSFSVLEWGEC